MCLAEQIDVALAERNYGVATARKTGRRAEWPYVPVIDYRTGFNKVGHVRQIVGVAYATREEAVQRAHRQIDANRAHDRACLLETRYRAFRRQLGLPEEIDVAAAAIAKLGRA